MSRRTKLLGIMAMATCIALATSAVPSQIRVQYPEIMDCEIACSVAAGGWPFAYLVDYPGLSPVGSVSLLGASLGIDKLKPGALAATFLCWWALVAAVVLLLGRRPR